MNNNSEDLFQNIFVYITKGTHIDASIPPKLSEYGAVVALNLNKRITHVISNENDNGDDLEQAKELNVKIVTVDFFLESMKVNSLRLEENYYINKKKKQIKPSSGNKRTLPDKFCNNFNSVKVYDDGKCVWKCTLNQTSTSANSNKFYIIEIHESISFPKKYSLWKRYGRVGYDGKGISSAMSSLEDAIDSFEKLFYQKTSNAWNQRHYFQTYPNKYTLIEIDDDDDDDDSNANVSNDVPSSKLDVRVQDLIKLIFDNSMMNNTATKLNYDIKKQPLGKLSKKIIYKAMNILKEIEDLIKNGIVSGPKLDDLVNQFYTFIPHDFGFKKPTPINNLVILQEKIDLLETLTQIKNANSLESKNQIDNKINPLDRKFSLLNLNVKPIDRNTKIWDILNKYIKDTHAPTHNHYTLTLLDAFEISKQSEQENFIDLDNQMLLWHGSRLSNFVGILSQGLRIAPPEAPSTGYMFGKGIYFADICSKSANYCNASNSDNIGLLILCQVSLGEMMSKTSEFFVTKLPPKYQSVIGVGKSHPDPSDFTILDGNIKVPYGKTVKNPAVKESALLYNEYIVYDTNQVKFKYLVKVRFNFK